MPLYVTQGCLPFSATTSVQCKFIGLYHGDNPTNDYIAGLTELITRYASDPSAFIFFEAGSFFNSALEKFDNKWALYWPGLSLNHYQTSSSQDSPCWLGSNKTVVYGTKKKHARRNIANNPEWLLMGMHNLCLAAFKLEERGGADPFDFSDQTNFHNQGLVITQATIGFALQALLTISEQIDNFKSKSCEIPFILGSLHSYALEILLTNSSFLYLTATTFLDTHKIAYGPLEIEPTTGQEIVKWVAANMENPVFVAVFELPPHKTRRKVPGY